VEVHDLLELVRHERALCPHHDRHVVDQQHRGQTAHLQRVCHLGLVVRVNLEDATAVACAGEAHVTQARPPSDQAKPTPHYQGPVEQRTVMLGNLVHLRRHQLARAAPHRKHVQQDGRRAVLQLRLKLLGRHLADCSHC